MYHHAKFHADWCQSATIAAISVTGQRKNSKLTILWRLTSECTTEIRSTDRGETSTEVPSVQRFLSSRHSWAPRTSCSIVRCAHRASYHVSPADCSAGCSPCSTQRSTRTRSLRGCAAGTTCHSWRWSGTRAPGCRRHTYSWYSVLDTGRSGPRCNPDPFVYHGILHTHIINNWNKDQHDKSSTAPPKSCTIKNLEQTAKAQYRKGCKKGYLYLLLAGGSAARV